GRLSRMAGELGVAGQVRFIGQRCRDELARYYSAANVFVTTPWYEPFGITPLEAMACARPVVGANVGGIRYSVVNGMTGFLVPPRDPLAVAIAIARLYHDRRLAQQMGLNGLARARERFTWSNVVDELVAAYLAAARPRVIHALAANAPAATLPGQFSLITQPVAASIRTGSTA